MATVVPTDPTSGTGTASGDGSVKIFQWTLTSANADGYPIRIPEWADVTWTVTATWGTATAFKIQGSADGTTFVTTGLSNAAGGAEVSIAADKVFTTIERPLFMRPIITSAGSGATLVVTAVCRRTSGMRA